MRALRRTGFDLVQFQQSAYYDALMRLLLLVWSIGFAMLVAIRLAKYEREVDPLLPDLVLSVSIAMQLAVIAFFLTLAATVLSRTRPMAKARGWEPRISALIGTFLVPVVVLFPRRDLSLTAGLVSTALLLVGNVMAVYCLSHLGRSFSIMPEARGMVTSGLYRHLRHPLYLAEMIASIGTVLQFLSVWTAVILLIQIGFQMRRMHNEETVLTQIFPVYEIYKSKTARVIPRIY